MRWRILAVDDDPDIGRQIKGLLQGRIKKGGDEIVIHTLQNFDDALGSLDTMLYDIIILDVFKGKPVLANPERAGEDILLDIKKRCFIPVIFYTALPAKVQQYCSNLVKVVHKTTGGTKNLKKEVIALLKTGLPGINRRLIGYFGTVQAKYMWEFVEPNLRDFNKAGDAKSLAYLLSRRLAASFSRENISNLISSFGGIAGQQSSGEDMVHPIEHYIWPAVSEQFMTGDILFRKSGGKSFFFVILTPSCDLVRNAQRKIKCEKVIIAECIPLCKTKEALAWSGLTNTDTNGARDIKDKLKDFLKNRKKERYYFLPGTFFLPDLIVDMEAVYSIPLQKMNAFKKAATLDSPFAECLLNRFSRYVGRVGIPELYDSELEIIAETLRHGKKKQK